MLESNAENFLKNTDAAYSECSAGIANLDRIIVGVHSGYSSITRAYLLPIIYAYWERFFKTVFSEFLVCIEANNVPLKYVNSNIAKFRIRKEIASSLKQNKIRDLHELLSKCEIPDMVSFFSDFSMFFENPIKFSDPSDWISTESNVRFSVLEKNCKNLGIDIGLIKNTLEESNMELYSNLNKLADTRNKIAHGESFEEVTSDEWEFMKGFVLVLMSTLQKHLYKFLNDKQKVFNSVISI